MTNNLLDKERNQSLEYHNRIEWQEKEKAKWLAHRPNAIFFVRGNSEKKV